MGLTVREDGVGGVDFDEFVFRTRLPGMKFRVKRL